MGSTAARRPALYKRLSENTLLWKRCCLPGTARSGGSGTAGGHFPYEKNTVKYPVPFPVRIPVTPPSLAESLVCAGVCFIVLPVINKSIAICFIHPAFHVVAPGCFNGKSFFTQTPALPGKRGKGNSVYIFFYRCICFSYCY